MKRKFLHLGSKSIGCGFEVLEIEKMATLISSEPKSVKTVLFSIKPEKMDV
jgi:hypothetical protein